MSVFYYLSFAAIIAGGTLSAFTARNPTRFHMWLTAYLVLVVGVMQCGFVYCLHRLTSLNVTQILIGLTLFNVGNACVIGGRYFKARTAAALPLVQIGGLCLAIAMLLLIIGTKAAPMNLTHICLLLFSGVILISAPIGLALSERRQ